MTLRCSSCGEVVFRGRTVDYEYPRGSGNWKQDTVGEFEDGAGECKGCGEVFCADCDELDEDGLCPACRKAEEEQGYIPF